MMILFTENNHNTICSLILTLVLLAVVGFIVVIQEMASTLMAITTNIDNHRTLQMKGRCENV
jgi:hypothetical protein